jgi:hypothetical protein
MTSRFATFLTRTRRQDSSYIVIGTASSIVIPTPSAAEESWMAWCARPIKNPEGSDANEALKKPRRAVNSYGKASPASLVLTDRLRIRQDRKSKSKLQVCNPR